MPRPSRPSRLWARLRPRGSGASSASQEARGLADSGLVDAVWVASVLSAGPLSDLDAAAAVLKAGGACPPTPLIDLLVLPPRVRSALAEGRAGPLLDHLADRGDRRPTGPLFDPRVAGSLAPFLADTTDDVALPSHPGLTLASLRHALLSLEAPPLLPTTTTLLVPADDDRVSGDRGVLAAGITATTALRSSESLAVLLVVDDPSPAALLHLRALALVEPRLTWGPGPLARVLGRLASPYVAVLPAGARARGGWLGPLLRRLDEPGVAAAGPVLLRPDDTLVGIGPDLELAGFPTEDARVAGGRSFAALPEALIAPLADVVALEPPVSPADLGSRLAAAGRLVLEPASLVTLPDPGPLPVVPPPPVRALSVVEGRPRLRWGLRLPSPPGHGGDAWGDTHFAAALARALSDLGQEVVSHRLGAHGGPAASHDEVALGLRGLHPVGVQPGAVNVLWVISHPAEVDPAELVGFDVVAAASASWGRSMSHRADRPVETLLQATDPGLGADLARPAGDGSRPVFVGVTKPDRPRRIVLDALAGGVPVEVHGPGWTGLVPPSQLGSAYVANDGLGTLYRTHGLVLADHWPDMAADGFLANRLFDAVASGARVVCDQVAGTEVFEGAVRTYADPADLAHLCSAEGRALFPDAVELDRIARRVGAQHSFARRAEQLLDLVVPAWQASRS